jgi:hypothetical protein
MADEQRAMDESRWLGEGVARRSANDATPRGQNPWRSR